MVGGAPHARAQGATDGAATPAADLPLAIPLSQLLVPPSVVRTGSAAGRGANRGSTRRPQGGWAVPAATNPISGTLLATAAAAGVIAAGWGAVEDADAATDVGPPAGGWVRKASAHRESDGVGVGRLEQAVGGGSDAAEAKAVRGRAVTAPACGPCACSMERPTPGRKTVKVNGGSRRWQSPRAAGVRSSPRPVGQPRQRWRGWRRQRHPSARNRTGGMGTARPSRGRAPKPRSGGEGSRGGRKGRDEARWEETWVGKKRRRGKEGGEGGQEQKKGSPGERRCLPVSAALSMV